MVEIFHQVRDLVVQATPYPLLMPSLLDSYRFHSFISCDDLWNDVWRSQAQR